MRLFGLSTMHWIPRARHHVLRNLVKKYAIVKYIVTLYASKVYVDGAYRCYQLNNSLCRRTANGWPGMDKK